MINFKLNQCINLCSDLYCRNKTPIFVVVCSKFLLCNNGFSVNNLKQLLNLNKSGELTASAQDVESSKIFKLFRLTCRVTTRVVKIIRKALSILPLEYSRYDSTDLFKLNNFTILSKYFLLLIVVCSLSACNQVKYGAVFDRGYHLPKKISQKSQQKTVKKISKKVSQKKLPRYYVVKNGDTLYSIAWNFGKDVNELKKINKIDSKYTIFANQKILLMASRQQDKTIKHYKKAKPLSWIKKTKNIKPINTSKKTKSLWGWPVKKVQAHSIKRNNVSKKGVNIVGKLGQSIIASASGKVVYSGSGLIGYGKLIIIKHNRNYLSAYAYNKKLLVKEGEGVKKGQQIATMGYKYKKAVLHFEIRKNGKPVNPMNYLPKI